MTHLAKELGLSGVGLRKICFKYGIPLPQRGYWARPQVGKQDPRPELPIENKNPQMRLSDEDTDPDFDASFEENQWTFGD